MGSGLRKLPDNLLSCNIPVTKRVIKTLKINFIMSDDECMLILRMILDLCVIIYLTKERIKVLIASSGLFFFFAFSPRF